MKRILCLLLTLAVCCGLCACRQEAPKIQEPVQFYYRRTVPVYGTADGIIAPVTVEGAGRLEKPEELLNEYLRGTAQEDFEQTFPVATKLLSLTIDGDTAVLRLNPSIAGLSGMDLTIACACLTLTTIALTGVTTVRINAGNVSLDGAEEIVMDRGCLTMLDLYVPETT